MFKNGAITGYIDVAQIVLYAFWIFFAGLIIYLRREDKREGYPLESDRSDRAPRVAVQGFPAMPAPKTFLRDHGESPVSVPNGRNDDRPLAARAKERWPGAPIEPTGNPMLDGVGPGSYAMREDVPDLTLDGQAKIVPLRVAHEFYVPKADPNPVGMLVLGADGVEGGVVHDVWVDRAEPQIRYLEVAVNNSSRRVLLPIVFSRFEGPARHLWVKVGAILGSQFAAVPPTAHPDRVTRLEEDKISAYYGGGMLYATKSRREPLL